MAGQGTDSHLIDGIAQHHNASLTRRKPVSGQLPGSVYGPIYISGSANVQLGDRYSQNTDFLEHNTAEQQRSGKYKSAVSAYL